MNIAVIGCGVMGGAFARAFAKQHTVLLYDRNQTKSEHLTREIHATAHKSIPAALTTSEIILLAIKPKDLVSFTKTVDHAHLKGKLILSILAGTSLSQLRHYFPHTHAVRLMPNLALICGQGVIGVAEDESISEPMELKLKELLAPLGLIFFLPEKNLQALTAVAASGLGFVFALMEGMIDGGIFLGLPAKDARTLVLKTFEGAVALAHHTQEHPAELKEQICSPGGTTIAGLRVLEQKGVRSGIMETLIACHKRESELEQQR